MLLVLLARLVRTWKQALLIVQPDTLLRWHRELFRLVWKRRSKAASHQPKSAMVKACILDVLHWAYPPVIHPTLHRLIPAMRSSRSSSVNPDAARAGKKREI